MAERRGHVGAGAVREDAALGDLGGELDHLEAHGGEDDGREFAGALLGGLADALDELADVGEGLAGLDAEALLDRAVGDADAEVESAAAELVDERGLVREVGRLAEVDGLDGGAEGDAVGGEGDGDREAHGVAEAGEVDAGVAAAFELFHEVDGGLAAAGDGGE